jgi:hypothetical protein
VPDSVVNLVNPQGDLVGVSPDQAQDALDQGYSQATPQDIHNHVLQQNYGTPVQQGLTAIEQAGNAATFGLSTQGEQMLGVPAKDIRNRREANPGVTGLSQAGGLAASIMEGGPAAEILHGAGEGALAVGSWAMDKLGIEAAKGVVGKIGAQAVKQAAEMAAFQTGDEASKLFTNDPEQSLGTALTSIGAASLVGGVLGGATGAPQALWKATKGAELEGFLGALKDKMTGVAGADHVSEMAQQAGMTIPPELKAALSGESNAVRMAQELRESASGAGEAMQAAHQDMLAQAHKSIFDALGKDPEAVAGQDISAYQTGSKLKEAIAAPLRNAAESIEAQFAPIEEKFSKNALPEGFHTDLQEKLGKIAVDNSYGLRTESPEMAELSRVMKDIPNAKTLEDFRNLQSQVRVDLGNKRLFGLKGQVMGAMRDAETSALDSVLGKEAPELVSQVKGARDAYKGVMGQIEQLNDALHVGKFKGINGFLKHLGELGEERVLSRLAQPNNVNLTSFLSEHYPYAADLVRSHHIDGLLQKAVNAPGAEAGMNSRVFFKGLDKMSPEMRAFSLPEGAADKLKATQDLLDRIPKRMNPSGTARTLDAIWKKLPGGMAGMLSMLTGHNPIAGYVLGTIGRHVGREVPDAAKLALLKFLGSEGPANAGAFKAVHDMADHAIRGQGLINGAVKSLFKGAEDVLPEKAIPTDQQKEKLAKFSEVAQNNPQALEKFGMGDDASQYMPDHVMGMGMLAGRMSSFLASVKPDTSPPGPLSPPRVPTAAEKAKYDTALTIAQQPLSVLQHVKDGSLTPFHIQALDAMYPSLYKGLKVHAIQSMAEAHTKEVTIPYKTKMGMSLFLGMPLDPSISPANLMANQTPPVPQGGPQQGPQKPSQAGLKGLSKLSSNLQTSSQTREQDRAQKA